MISFADLIRELDSTGVMFTAYAWATPTGDADAWGAVFVTGSRPVYGEDGHAEECLTVKVSMCTRSLDETAFAAVSDKLRQLGEDYDLIYRLGSPRYEESTQLLFYDWNCEGVLLSGFE